MRGRGRLTAAPFHFLDLLLLGPREAPTFWRIPCLLSVEALYWAHYTFRFLPADIWLQGKKLTRPFKDFRFGETPWCTGEAILREAQIGSQDLFVDLGCGRGKMVFLAHLLSGAKSRGVELLPTYVKIARRMAGQLHLTGVTFQQRDFTQVNLHDATIVYVAGSVFEPETHETLLELVSQLREGATWMSVGWQCTHPDLVLISENNYLFSWGRENLYRYRVVHS